MTTPKLLPCRGPIELLRMTKKSWEAMLNRCRSNKHVHYNDYGGRGIAVCDRWLLFENFLADMGSRPSKNHSIDRIDNNGNYEPGNCRWATRIEQHRNKRSNRHITAMGETHTLAGWAERTGLLKQTIRMRLERGWPDEDAVTESLSLNGWTRIAQKRADAWNTRAPVDGEKKEVGDAQ